MKYILSSHGYFYGIRGYLEKKYGVHAKVVAIDFSQASNLDYDALRKVIDSVPVEILGALLVYGLALIILLV